MARVLAPPLPEGCPWSGWTPPNVDWCEQELCAFVVNPANTWSNLLYVALGVLMWWEARRLGRRDLAAFGPASVVVGVFSLVYHASYTYFFQFFDFVGMFVFCFLPIALNARRLGWIGQQRELAVHVGGVVAFSAAVPPLFELGVPIQGLVLLLVLVIVGQELTLRARTSSRSAYPWFWTGLALLSAGALLSALDVTRVWCDPTHPFLQGHAAWHLLSAASLYSLFRFYRAIRKGTDLRVK
jgi:hypothetical protein